MQAPQLGGPRLLAFESGRGGALSAVTSRAEVSAFSLKAPATVAGAACVIASGTTPAVTSC